jgi:diadenylate cyclase
LIKGTRAVQVLKGIGVLILVYFVSKAAGLDTINWILEHFWTIGLVAFVIVFQPELRRALAHMGQNRIWMRFLRREEEEFIEEIVRGTKMLSSDRLGALIAIERNVGLKTYIQTGVKIEARLSAELINTIFSPKSLLHDGAIIIRENRIVAASCLFPLTENSSLSVKFGTRHRAALGLSEETDAVVIVVSEETGKISVAMSGKIAEDLDEGMLREILTLYATKESAGVSLERS